MTNPTVAEYTLRRLAALGIDKVFGVPGDYAFPVNDAAEVIDGLGWRPPTNSFPFCRRRTRIGRRSVEHSLLMVTCELS